MPVPTRLLPTRLLAVLFGLTIPLVLASNAEAARYRRHGHHPASVRTATYRVVPHHARAHRHHAHLPTRGSIAMAPRHGISRGS